MGGNVLCQWYALNFSWSQPNKHLAGDSTWRNTTVRYYNSSRFTRPRFLAMNPYSVNGSPSVLIDQPNTGGGNVVLSVPIRMDLNSGTNSITFSAGQSSQFLSPILIEVILNTYLPDYAADLDKIIVYTAT